MCVYECVYEGVYVCVSGCVKVCVCVGGGGVWGTHIHVLVRQEQTSIKECCVVCVTRSYLKIRNVC